jgi:hypothetical protein
MIFLIRIRAQRGPREPLYELFCVCKTDLWSRDGPRSRRPRGIFEGNLNRVFGPGIFDRVRVHGRNGGVVGFRYCSRQFRLLREFWKDLLISVPINLDRRVGQIPQYDGPCSRNSAAGGVVFQFFKFPALIR